MQPTRNGNLSKKILSEIESATKQKENPKKRFSGVSGGSDRSTINRCARYSSHALKKILVAKTKIIDKVTKERRPCKYSDVPTDQDKWVNDLKYVPIPYDLLFLRIKGSSRPKNGWWNGTEWEGLRLKPFDKVTAWKRNFTVDYQ